MKFHDFQDFSYFRYLFTICLGNLRELRTRSDIEMYDNCARIVLHEGVDVRCSEKYVSTMFWRMCWCSVGETLLMCFSACLGDTFEICVRGTLVMR